MTNNNQEITDKQQLITTAYAAFNARNIDAVLQALHPEVKRSKAWEGDFANGHDAVRSYWEKQWKELDPHVTPAEFRLREGGILEVVVDQFVQDLQGNTVFNGKVLHIYTFKDGLLHTMNIENYPE